MPAFTITSVRVRADCRVRERGRVPIEIWQGVVRRESVVCDAACRRRGRGTAVGGHRARGLVLDVGAAVGATARLEKGEIDWSVNVV